MSFSERLAEIGRVVTEKLRIVALHASICGALVVSLLKFLICGTSTWVVMAIRLVLFATFLLSGWYGMCKYWLFSPLIVRNVEYGLGAKKRNLLDIYLPNPKSPFSSNTSNETDNVQQDQPPPQRADAPVVIFVTGGAWIIGYKLWGAFIGRGLSSMGILTIVPDYRNFPQGDLEDMMDDVGAAVNWTVANAGRYGGDKEKVVLAGQSAGAHICMCAMVDALKTRISQAATNSTSDTRSGSRSGSSNSSSDIISLKTH